MFLFVSFLFTSLLAAGQADWKASPDPEISKTDKITTQQEPSKKSDSYDEYAIIHTDNGFLPQKIYLKAKQNVKLYVTGVTTKNTSFIIDDLNIFKGVSKDKVTELSFVPVKEGAYPFYCPITNKKGWIIVKGE